MSGGWWLPPSIDWHTFARDARARDNQRVRAISIPSPSTRRMLIVYHQHRESTNRVQFHISHIGPRTHAPKHSLHRVCVSASNTAPHASKYMNIGEALLRHARMHRHIPTQTQTHFNKPHAPITAPTSSFTCRERYAKVAFAARRCSTIPITIIIIRRLEEPPTFICMQTLPTG